MNGKMRRIKVSVEALLASGELRATWLAALRRAPELARFEACIASPPSWSPTSRELASLVDIGERTFRKRVRRLIGLTPIEAITSLKLARAAGEASEGRRRGRDDRRTRGVRRRRGVRSPFHALPRCVPLAVRRRDAPAFEVTAIRGSRATEAPACLCTWRRRRSHREWVDVSVPLPILARSPHTPRLRFFQIEQRNTLCEARLDCVGAPARLNGAVPRASGEFAEIRVSRRREALELAARPHFSTRATRVAARTWRALCASSRVPVAFRVERRMLLGCLPRRAVAPSGG